MQAHINPWFLLLLLNLFITPVCADFPSVPDNYPSHELISGCGNNALSAIDSSDKRVLDQLLEDYTLQRLKIAEVLRTIVEEYDIKGDLRKRLLGFADTFDTLTEDMPRAHPDSEEFRGFDFRLGMGFTSMLYFISEDKVLADRFYAGRSDPESTMGHYVAQVDASRDAYFLALESVNKSGCS